MLASMHTKSFSCSFLFFLSILHNASALGIEITKPAGGSTLPAGPMIVQWSDAGGSPDMAALSTYALELLVGGNNPDDSQVIQTIPGSQALVSDASASINISASTAQMIQNGFYFKMTSQTKQGNEVINYSDRFTLTNMNGTTDNPYLDAANAAAGSVSNVPTGQYNVLVGQSPSTMSTATASASEAASATTPIDKTASPASSDDPLHNGGLSGGNVGLVLTGSILALVGAVSVVIWIMFFWRRARRRRQEEATPKKALDDPSFLDNKTELGAYRSSRVVSTSRSPVEMNAETDRQELSAVDKPLEIPASPMVYELEGDMSAWEAGSGRRSKAWEAV